MAYCNRSLYLCPPPSQARQSNSFRIISRSRYHIWKEESADPIPASTALALCLREAPIEVRVGMWNVALPKAKGSRIRFAPWECVMRRPVASLWTAPMELGFDLRLSRFEACSFVFSSQSLRGDR